MFEDAEAVATNPVLASVREAVAEAETQKIFYHGKTYNLADVDCPPNAVLSYFRSVLKDAKEACKGGE